MATDEKRMRLLRYGLGGLLVAAGIAAVLYGGYLAAVLTDTGGSPHYLAGFALCFAGVLVVAAGLWLCGVELDLSD